MTKEEDNKPRVVLDREDILFLKKPLLPGYMIMDPGWKHDAYLKIIDVLGIDSVNESFGEYFHVNASAVKYLADVALFNGNRIFCEDTDKTPTNPIERQILFSGGIQIFQKIDIEDQEINGYQFIRNGKIYSIAPDNDLYRESEGLSKLIFGEALTTEERSDRIRAIMRSYDDQELAENRAEDAARQRARENGTLSGRWLEQHGYSIGRIP